MAMTMMADQAALHDLDHHWGDGYDIAVTSSGWVAKRLDNGRALVASGPGGLRELIVADSTAEPVPRVQAAALRAAFPGYVVNVIVMAHGEKPRYELVSKDGGDPYCLISSDAREIWWELSG
jgi:hypothetical protein